MPPASSSAAAPRRSCRPSRWSRSSRRSRSPPAPRSPSSATPTPSPTSSPRTYAAGGVNRLSFGVQSMVPHVLASLGRTHDVANVERSVATARRHGFTSFNLDLIYGAAGETVDDWRRTLEAALALEPPHISAYALTIEAGTPLADEPDRHPVDDDQADKYLLAVVPAPRRRARQLRDLELGPARPRVPPQPPVLGPGRLPRLRLRRPLPPAGPPLVEPAHARALRRRGGGGRHHRGRRRGPRRRDPGHRAPPARSCAPAPACPRTPSTPPTSRRSPVWSRPGATAGS